MTVRDGSDSRGQSSTIATLLLVAVALAIVGSLVLFVGGVADSLTTSPPSATVTVGYDADRGVLTLTHRGGDRLDADETRTVEVIVEDGDTGATTRFTWVGSGGTADVTAGESFTIDDAGGAATGDATFESGTFEAGDVVRVVWRGESGSDTLLTHTIGADARRYVTWTVEPRDDLTRQYTFDDAQARVVGDESGSPTTYDATPSGPETGVPGQVGTAYRFTSSEGDYVALPKGYDTRGALSTVSACAWFNSDASTGRWDNWAFLDFDRSEYFNLFLYGNGSVGFATTSEGGTIHDMATPGSYNDGTWHQACAVYDGTEKHIYVDGTRRKTANPYGGAPLGTGTTRYGYLGDGSESGSVDGNRNGLHYDGSLDEVRLYERALSTSEIQDLYDADTGGTVTPPTADLVAYYPLDEDFGNVDATVRDTGGDTAADGTHTGVTFGAGVVDGGASFDGTAYVALDGAYDERGAFPTLSACGWFRTSESTGGRSDNWAILDFDRSEYFNLYVHGDGRVGFSSTDTSGRIDDFYTGATYNDGTWHHACGVYDGTTKAIYVDGDLKVEQPAHGGRAIGTGTTRYGYIGEGSESSSVDGDRNRRFYEGDLDDVRLYERALDDDAVERLYQATGGTPGDTTFETAVASYPDALAHDDLVLENVAATVPAGTNVTVTVLADPDADGTFEETSDSIRVDGSGSYDVTGITTDAARYKLRVELDEGSGVSPTFGGAELVEDD